MSPFHASRARPVAQSLTLAALLVGALGACAMPPLRADRRPSAISPDPAPTSAPATDGLSPDITAWLAGRLPSAESLMTANISPALPGYPKGFVLAAPWAVAGQQNYRYHWVRDAALVMNTLVTRYLDVDAQGDANLRKEYFGRLRDYVNFSKRNQAAPEPAGAEAVGLGETKFNPDGTRVTQWMRPQNDGPALRVITLSRFADRLWQAGRQDLVRHLYDGSKGGSGGIDAGGAIGADLAYLRAHWPDLGYDPWEEVKAHHFYTRLVQRKALLDGARIASLVGDSAGALASRKEAASLEQALLGHWLADGQATPIAGVSTGQIWDSFDRSAGADYKSTGLDVATILGALHGHNELDAKGDRFFSPSDERVLRTAFLLARAFAADFPLAKILPANLPDAGLGAPIGRYPKDRFNGLDSAHLGNPWYLATAAFAELYFRCAEEWRADGQIAVSSLDLEFLATLLDPGTPLKAGETIQPGDARFTRLVAGVRALGDAYLRRVKLHEGPGGHLNEEFSRDDGKPQGAENLSWSYASILSAAHHR